MSVNLIWTNVQLMPLVLTLMGVMNVDAILDSLEMARHAVSAWLAQNRHVHNYASKHIHRGKNTEVETA